MAVSAGGQRCGRSGSGSRNEFNGRQECCRVSLGTLGHRPDDPGITTLFFGLAQQTAAPPHGRMPPVKSADDELEPAHPVIATFQMRKLVQQERRSLVEARFRPELTTAPAAGACRRSPRASAVPGRAQDKEHGASASPNRSAKLSRTRLPLLRCRVDLLHQAVESHDPHKSEYPPGDGTGQHHGQHNVLPAPASR